MSSGFKKRIEKVDPQMQPKPPVTQRPIRERWTKRQRWGYQTLAQEEEMLTTRPSSARVRHAINHVTAQSRSLPPHDRRCCCLHHRTVAHRCCNGTEPAAPVARCRLVGMGCATSRTHSGSSVMRKSQCRARKFQTLRNCPTSSPRSSSARDLNVPLSPHDKVIERMALLAARVDETIESFRQHGQLRAFNQCYRAHPRG